MLPTVTGVAGRSQPPGILSRMLGVVGCPTFRPAQIRFSTAALRLAGGFGTRSAAPPCGSAAMARHYVTVTDSATVTLRLPLTALMGVFALIVCMTPVALGVPGLQVLYLLPAAWAVWLVRTRTVVGPEAMVAYRVWGSRRINWSDLAGLRIDDRARVWAVLHGGDEVGLPAVQVGDLSILAANSGGRLPDPLAEVSEPPAFEG
jgi:hypothetical protein